MSSRRPLAERPISCTMRRMPPAPDDPQARVVRAARGDLERLQRDDLLAAGLVVLLDVPGVPVARLVLRDRPKAGCRVRRAPRARSPCGRGWRWRRRRRVPRADARSPRRARRRCSPGAGVERAAAQDADAERRHRLAGRDKSVAGDLQLNGRASSEGLTTSTPSLVALRRRARRDAERRASAPRCAARDHPVEFALGVLIDLADARSPAGCRGTRSSASAATAAPATPAPRRPGDAPSDASVSATISAALGAAVLAFDAALASSASRGAAPDTSRPTRPAARRPRRVSWARAKNASTRDQRACGSAGKSRSCDLAGDHFRRHAAAAVAIADRQQSLVVTVLLAEIAPRSAPSHRARTKPL